MRVLAFAAAIALSQSAFAARQSITCKEVTESRSKHTLSVNIDPDIELNEVSKTGKHGFEIVPYTAGISDTGGESSARVSVDVPGRGDYSGTYKWSGFYVVNEKRKAGEGYSYKFENKAYRIIHGFDKDYQWDMMFYYPETAVGQAPAEFPGLITMQMSIMDQGYFHIDVTCSSKVK